LLKTLLHIISTLWSQLKIEVEVLLARIKLLEGQKNKNSRNSSKPPSTDKSRKTGKKVVKNSRQKSGKRTGGQPGNKGATLEQVNDAKYTELHTADLCTCGADVQEVEVEKLEIRQVFEMEQPEIAVTEHQVEVKICPICQKVVKGVFPQGVTAHRILQGTYRTGLVNALLAQKVLHGDETGLYFGGKRNWLHVLSTSKLTLFAAHTSRGSEAIEEMGVLPLFEGRVIHDNYKSYGIYQNCKHGLCNSHHLRELLFFEEEEEALWAYHLGVFLCSVNKHVKQRKNDGYTDLATSTLLDYRQRYLHILHTGYEHLSTHSTICLTAL